VSGRNQEQSTPKADVDERTAPSKGCRLNVPMGERWLIAQISSTPVGGDNADSHST
jgi:hypothetical protein